jgi:hypothetical protein
MMQEALYTHKFLLRHHWWIDAGLVGLYYIAVKVKDKNAAYSSIRYLTDAHSLTFQAPSEGLLKEFLDKCYSKLTDTYWNVSTKKQQESKELVIYYKETDKLDVVPRRKPSPIPALFTKGSSFRADGEEYDKLSPDLQKRIDYFLEENHKILWGSKKRLLFEQPVCHPEIEIFPTRGKKTTCCICGQDDVCSDVSQPSFLLFASPTATLSFNSEGKRPDKICWECEFLSKFAVESAHYKSSDENLYILQLSTGHVQKLINSHAILGSQSSVRQLDMDNYLSNIGTQKLENRLLYYARLPYELLWSFYHDTYELLRTEAETRAKSLDELMMLCTKPFIEMPLQLTLLMTSPKGPTFMLKEIINYTETTYIFRLLHSFREEFSIDLKFLFKVFQELYLPVKKDKPFDTNNYLCRNHILQQVLLKKPILNDIEQLAFRKSLQQEFPYIGNLLEFTRHYQFIIQEGCDMTKDQVEVAVNLGKQIVISARETTGDTSNSNFDRVKGDLFALRKTRTVTDFLEQLNRIQFRYNISVSNQILGGILEEPGVAFADFKSYCLLAALNTFNNYKRPKDTKQV